ncbi:MAG: LptF/LptG family permease [Calditrichaeota bacterium]|nr:LptF/LptG family permease [Calditrichota bacterium]
MPVSRSKPFIFHRYILKEHIGPFFFALSLIVFLFLMNYTLREVHRLFGRGLDTIIILKMYYYSLAPILALAVPMSVLVATAMAFVRLASDSEITILRSSGINLIRIILPVFIAACLIAVGMYHFNNTILPAYNVESSRIRVEISRVKPTSTLYEKTFTEIKDVKLYVERIDDSFNEKPDLKVRLLGEQYRDIPVDHLFDVIIYDDRSSESSKTFIAQEGFLLLNQVQEKFEFILWNGEIHEIEYAKSSKYKRSFFKQTTFYINASDFVFRDDDDNYNRSKSNRQKSASELKRDLLIEYSNIVKRHERHVSSFKSKRIANSEFLNRNYFKSYQETKREIKLDRQIREPNQMPLETDTLFSESSFKRALYYPFKNVMIGEKKSVESTIRLDNASQTEIDDLEGEYHKKFAIPIASIIFVLIGAPLGMLTRKGDVGSAAVVCLLVFIIYYICLILGEDWSEDGLIAPWLGLWAGNIVGVILSALFLYMLSIEKSVADLKIFNLFAKRSR